jgi:hypothetical protein
MMRPPVSSRQQPEVTPVVPFKNKVQYYQRKHSFLITGINPYLQTVANPFLKQSDKKLLSFNYQQTLKRIRYCFRFNDPQ